MQAVKKPLSLVKNIIFVFVFIFYYLYKKPKHTLYEITVIRFLATIHPLVPKFLARFRSFIINNKTKKNVSLLNNSELIFFKDYKKFLSLFYFLFSGSFKSSSYISLIDRFDSYVEILDKFFAPIFYRLIDFLINSTPFS
jgi:hypothetical protein